MTVATSRFGILDVSRKDILEVTSALPGFPDTSGFVFVRREEIKPLCWLQSAQDPGLTLVVVEPRHYFRHYKPFVPQSELREIGAESIDDVTLYVIVMIPKDLAKMTANLRRPLIVNRETGKMKQVRAGNEKYSYTESVLDGIRKSESARMDTPDYDIHLN